MPYYYFFTLIRNYKYDLFVCIEINSNHTNANYNLGLVFYKLKQLEKAKNFLEKTVKAQPNFAIAFFKLGNLYVEIKEFDKAF